jgi:hypothetical protein
MSTASISFEFLKRIHAMPSWSEIAYGFEHQLVPPNVVIDYAMDKIATCDQPNDNELVIASFSVNDSIAERVKQIAEEEVNDEDVLRLRWANILLAWVYEHRDDMDDPPESSKRFTQIPAILENSPNSLGICQVTLT